MVTSFLLLFLPLAAASGWFAGKRSSETSKKEESNQFFVQDYLVGLNYLLNEQPDKAVDTFIKLLEVDNETVETHLALGALFRRRGEVDRAIRIHQNLIARPQLAKNQRIGALLALAQDYLKAGFLDRAERLFTEVIETDSNFKTTALTFLLDIYQQQKQWRAAIDVADKLFATDAAMDGIIAHYYCELAQEVRFIPDIDQAQQFLKLALKYDPSCSRANLILGALEMEKGNFSAALMNYQQIKNQQPEYICEAIGPLSICYEQLGRLSEFQEYLKKCLLEHPQISILFALVEHIKFSNGVHEAIDFLTKHLHKNPSVQGLHRLINLHLAHAEEKLKENLLTFQDLTQRLLREKPNYHCDQCGFNSKVLIWHCPGCKGWGELKPV